MLDFLNFNFDLDGDGINDSYAVDTDGDGTFDTFLLDLDDNGVFDTTLTMFDANDDGQADAFAIEQDIDENGVVDVTVVGLDSNGDSEIDHYYREADLDQDGYAESVTEMDDYDQNGEIDHATTYTDIDDDGNYDVVTKEYDSNGDDIMDTTDVYFDLDGNGSPDAHTGGRLFDSDDDGVYDTFINQIDNDGDGVFEATEIYDYNADTGELELSYLSEADGSIGRGTYAVELDNFDPDNADPDLVSGNPADAMEAWEFQGDTNRCAVYSQKFVIEELTGEEVDIDDLVEMAEGNGWFTEEGGTPLLNMNKLLDEYGLDNEMSFNNNISDINDCLENGGKVIVAIDADEIWYGESNDLFTPGDGANHAVEVIGVDNSDPDNPYVILNDSGNPDGCGEMIPLDTFCDAWEDSNCLLITVAPEAV